MAITIAPQFTVRNYTWTNWKTILESKAGIYQYDDDGTQYTIYFYDEPEVHVCVIWKSIVPDGIISGGYSQSQNNSDKTDFENNYQSGANKPVADTDDFRRRIVEVNFRKGTITNTTYYLLVDLNNASGAYKHDSGTKLKMAGVHGVIAKDTAIDQWILNIGVILSITGSNATVGWVRFGNANVRDAGVFQHEITLTTFPFLSNFTVSGGDFTYIADNFKEVTADLTTSTAIEDISGGTYIPAPGDLIMRATKTSGTGSLLVHYHLWYTVE